jgi:hypothetical protein
MRASKRRFPYGRFGPMYESPTILPRLLALRRLGRFAARWRLGWPATARAQNVIPSRKSTWFLLLERPSDTNCCAPQRV